MSTAETTRHIPAHGNRSVGWAHVRLGDHVTLVRSGLTPDGGAASYLEKGIPLIRSQNVLMNRFTCDGLAYMSEFQDERMSGSRVRPDDVLLNITGASIGRVCIVPKDICPANVNQHVCVIRTADSLDPHFLSYCISSPMFQRFIADSQAGATRQALTKFMIEGFLVPLPPLPEQRRIVAVLKEQMAAVEKARAAAQARLEAAKTLPAAFLRDAFRVCDSSLPADWQWTTLEDTCDLLPSRSISSAGDAEAMVATTACLTETGFAREGIKTARMLSQDVPECLLSVGEVLIARSNTPELVGRAAMFEGDPIGAVACDLTIRLRTRATVNPGYLARYLSMLFVRGHWRTQAGGASGSMKKITRTQVLRLPVPCPPMAEQQRIDASLKQQMVTAQKLLSTAEQGLESVNALPAALLRWAFRGDL